MAESESAPRWRNQANAALSAFGEYLRTQRRLAKLTLRELSDLTNVSNPYLSQVERGLHRPSVQVLTAIAKALDLSAETLFSQAAGLQDEAMRTRHRRTPKRPSATTRTSIRRRRKRCWPSTAAIATAPDT